jgi:hypothetical protein
MKAYVREGMRPEDYRFVIGGPRPEGDCVHIFRAGDEYTFERVQATEGYPPMYRIVELSRVGIVSRGVLSKFFDGFEPSAHTKPGSS